MEKNLRKAYSEICIILSLLEKEYLNKIPTKLIDFFNEEKDENYKPNIDINKMLESQVLQKDTLTILAILYLNYWYESEQEKQELLNLFGEVDKINAEKYSIANIFKNNGERRSITEYNESKSLMVTKENIFYRFLNKIKNFFTN